MWLTGISLYRTVSLALLDVSCASNVARDAANALAILSAALVRCAAKCFMESGSLYFPTLYRQFSVEPWLNGYRKAAWRAAARLLIVLTAAMKWRNAFMHVTADSLAAFPLEVNT
ncbi:hypothetical protein BDN70DRAFT_988436 [Pholiota conissans]|uniref:Secreted protein n=1 Tax=Pholiota conissans TaxID=109636 RepID=A0A9P6D7K9_9AGAR|nr:hypothetical protein BDN70DRAFT_988436 [Pholiota conissans]